MFESRYQQLNPEQQQAVDTIYGPVLVVAGPGSGKTELLSLRVANILKQTDSLPQNILCLTFTEAAALNMRDRLQGLIGQAAHHVSIHTFHSFGSDIINRYRSYFFGGASFEPADDVQSIEMMNDIIEKLPHGHTFKKYHPTSGYLYTKPLLSRVGDLKKGGIEQKQLEDILEQNKQFLEQAQPIFQTFFSSRLSKKHLEELPQLITTLSTLPGDDKALPFGLMSYKHMIISTLLEIHSTASSTPPLTAFKSAYFKHNDKKELVFKDLQSHEAYMALAQVYGDYVLYMHKQGYYDFDDMLMESTRIIKTHPEVQADLAEQYQFILVDEFQDTNGIQMQLLELLFEGQDHPNVLCVGDDDQAIFKFQGANVQNFLGFHTTFKDPTTVTLTKNYRSTQQILDYAKEVISHAEERIEHSNTAISKTLEAKNTTLSDGRIIEHSEPTDLHEYFYIGDEIKRLIESKTTTFSEIAIIARNHRQLQELSDVLSGLRIPITYERKNNILEQEHIQQLIGMIELCYYLAFDLKESNQLFAKVLHYEFWQIPSQDIWKLSLQSYKERLLWIELLEQSENPYYQQIASFFIDLAHQVSHDIPVEKLIDQLLGVPADHFDEDGNANDQVEQILAFISPFKAYYFDQNTSALSDSNYIALLSQLRTFIHALRNHKKRDVLYTQDALHFLQVFQEYGLPLNDHGIYNQQQDAVSLLTGHKSKGLEYRTVFVIGCVDTTWIPKPRAELLQLPKNLPLMPSSDTLDDKIRLFFVALTRAKENLYLTYHHTALNGKKQLPLRFLQQQADSEPPTQETFQHIFQRADEHVLLRWRSAISSTTSFSKDEKAVLQEVLEHYKLSVTHLNNFIDVAYAGPQVFLEANLLRFPQSMNKVSAYGSAMHAAIEQTYHRIKNSETLPSIPEMLDVFSTLMQHYRLSSDDYKEMNQYGREKLRIYLENNLSSFSADDLIEVNFAHEGVVIEGAHLSGKIDKMTLNKNEKTIIVTDFKTGSAKEAWQSNNLKLYKYKNQLIFYKLLVEHSARYRSYTTNTGVLEFLEDIDQKTIKLETSLQTQEIEMLSKLVGIVYRKIMNLDFPDTSNYPKNYYGVQQFVTDLLEGNV